MNKIPLIILFLIVFTTTPMAHAAVSNDRPVILQSVADNEWAPIYYFSGPEQQLQGMMADLLDELFIKELNWEPKTIIRPWARAQMEVKEGDTDFFISIPTEARKEYSIVTKRPIYTFSFTLYTYAEHPKIELIRQIRSIEDLRKLDLLLVSNLGNGWFKANLEEKGIRTRWVAGDEEILNFLALKRADATVEIAASTDHLIKKIGLVDQIIKTEVTFGSSDFFVMVGKKSPFASRMNEINSALQRMHERGTIQKVWSNYN